VRVLLSAPYRARYLRRSALDTVPIAVGDLGASCTVFHRGSLQRPQISEMLTRCTSKLIVQNGFVCVASTACTAFAINSSQAAAVFLAYWTIGVGVGGTAQL